MAKKLDKKVGHINWNFILSWTLFCPWLWPHSLTKTISKLCFPVYNLREYSCLFNGFGVFLASSLWSIHFQQEAEHPGIQSFPVVLAGRGTGTSPLMGIRMPEAASELPLTGLVTSPLGLGHMRSQGSVTSKVNILRLEFLFFFLHLLKISKHSPLHDSEIAFLQFRKHSNRKNGQQSWDIHWRWGRRHRGGQGR